MGFSGFALGMGGEGKSIDVAQERIKQEQQQRLIDALAQNQDKRAQEELELRERESRQRLQQNGAQQPIGNPIKSHDGKYYQRMWEPNTGKITTVELPGVSEFNSVDQLKEILGRDPNPDERQRLGGVAPPHTTEDRAEQVKKLAEEYRKVNPRATPQEAFRWAAAQMSSSTGRSYYGLYNKSGSKSLDTTGLTAGQKRMFDAMTVTDKALLNRLETSAQNMQLQMMINPQIDQDRAGQALENVNKQIEIVASRIEAAKNQIINEAHKHKRGDVITQGGVQYRVTKVDAAGKVTAADPVNNAPVRSK